MGETLVLIRHNGTLEYGPSYSPDETAKTFWEALALRAPRMCDCGKHAT